MEQQRLSGRRGQAAQNDERILAAAREVFVADADAPISAVASRAGVGISALYRRYPSKEDLLRQLCRDGLRRYVVEAEAALADEGDPWEAFAASCAGSWTADVHSLTVRLAGTFTPTEDMFADAAALRRAERPARRPNEGKRRPPRRRRVGGPGADPRDGRGDPTRRVR